MNEGTTQAMEKIADRIIQKVTQDFTEKLEVVRADITEKITQDFTEKLEVVRSELTKKIEESNEQLSQKLNEKMDTGFEMMHTQANTVEENLTSRIQWIENRMEKEAENRVTHYATKMEHKKLEERVVVIEGTLKLA